jgi:hypothetical protein
MDDIIFYLIIWSAVGALAVLGLAKMYPHWEEWKINTTLVLGGPMIWALMLYYTLFVEER